MIVFFRFIDSIFLYVTFLLGFALTHHLFFSPLYQRPQYHPTMMKLTILTTSTAVTAFAPLQPNLSQSWLFSPHQLKKWLRKPSPPLKKSQLTFPSQHPQPYPSMAGYQIKASNTTASPVLLPHWLTTSVLFSTPTVEATKEAVTSIQEISADISQPAPAVTPINGWVPNESLTC